VRISSAPLNSSNGDKACPGTITRPKDETGVAMECDECPMASTNQGAFTATGEGGVSIAGTARTFAGCQMPNPSFTGSNGWSRCFVHKVDNARAGNALQRFYRDERVLDSDRFRVGFAL
jgi:hypothetical protein